MVCFNPAFHINPTNGGTPNVCSASNQLAEGALANHFQGQYVPSTNDTDFAVTESDGCALQVSNNFNGTTFQADFAISFAGTKLAQILSSDFPAISIGSLHP